MEALLVRLALRSRWTRLDPRVHAYLRGYLAPVPEAQPHRVAPVDAAAPFHEDLVRGGPLLRAAFPDLVREVVAIEGTDRIVVRIACDGIHAGPFFGFMRATGRHARFTETHVMELRDGRGLVDQVTIDIRSIIRQLATASRGSPRAARA